MQTARSLLRAHTWLKWSQDGFSRLNMLWGVCRQDKTDLRTLGAVKESRVGNWWPEKSRGLINDFSLQRTLESLIKLWPASPKILEQFFSHFSLIHTNRNIHISPKVVSIGSNFIEPCKQDCVFDFCLPGQMQNPQYITENAVHSCHQVTAMPKKRLSCFCFVCKVAPMGPGPTLGCPTCTEAIRPI